MQGVEFCPAPKLSKPQKLPIWDISGIFPTRLIIEIVAKVSCGEGRSWQRSRPEIRAGDSRIPGQDRYVAGLLLLDAFEPSPPASGRGWRSGPKISAGYPRRCSRPAQRPAPGWPGPAARWLAFPVVLHDLEIPVRPLGFDPDKQAAPLSGHHNNAKLSPLCKI